MLTTRNTSGAWLLYTTDDKPGIQRAEFATTEARAETVRRMKYDMLRTVQIVAYGEGRITYARDSLWPFADRANVKPPDA